ncbi:hypothetical protein AVEN_236722-1 [Araneus ventricosus]|uniref:Uncharacterized protein n=1 Tax=Araneus ventricosus TaxID=182803 RepID=A0A4Y2JTV0_ARAVE|nr:hypothetical protein AVEN_236722-1 [Araneus ventricosus]
MKRTTPELGPPLQTSVPHQQEGVWPMTSDLTCTRPTYTADLKWNRVSNLETFSPEAALYHQATAVFSKSLPYVMTQFLDDGLLSLC